MRSSVPRKLKNEYTCRLTNENYFRKTMSVASTNEDNLHVSTNGVKHEWRYSPSNLYRICVSSHNFPGHPGCLHKDVDAHDDDYNSVNDSNGGGASKLEFSHKFLFTPENCAGILTCNSDLNQGPFSTALGWEQFQTYDRLSGSASYYKTDHLEVPPLGPS